MNHPFKDERDVIHEFVENKLEQHGMPDTQWNRYEILGILVTISREDGTPVALRTAQLATSMRHEIVCNDFEEPDHTW